MDNETLYKKELKKFYSIDKKEFGASITVFRADRKKKVLDLAIELHESSEAIRQAERGHIDFLLYLKISELYEENDYKWKI